MATESEKLVNDFCETWKSRDLDKIMGFFTEDAIYHNIPMEPARGKDAIRQTISSFLSMASAIEFRILHSVSAGRLVMNERIDAFEIGGKHVELPVAGVFEVRDGKISAWRDYFDAQMWTKQLS